MLICEKKAVVSPLYPVSVGEAILTWQVSLGWGITQATRYVML